MNNVLIDLTGQKFGKLTVLEIAVRAQRKPGAFHTKWKCQCDCGNQVDVNGADLRNGHSRSCGCLRSEATRSYNESRRQPKVYKEPGKRHVLIDLTGQRIGKLTVLEIAGRAHRKNRNSVASETLWLCQCDCGNQTKVRSRNLRLGLTRSCGCLRKDAMRASFRTHGECGKFASLEYRSWSAMRARCMCPTNKKYPIYGARGVMVCERWNSYENFLEDMGRKPSPEHSLDRINVNGNYEPSNCRWIGPKQQYWNRQDSLGQLFIEVARNRLPKELFDMIWQEALELQNQKTDK